MSPMNAPMSEAEARELLPWYAADSLEPEEHAAVEAALAASDDLRAELAELQVMQTNVSDTAGEAQWNPALITRTLARIDAHEAEQASAKGLSRFAEWLGENLFAGWSGVPTLAKAAVAVQFALLLALGGSWMAQPSDPGPYGTVGLDPDAAQIKLGFQPGIDEATLRETIRSLDGRIVDGPSALGLYTVELQSLEKEQEEEIGELLADLLARKDVIRGATKGY
ncbi:MAG: hypothetical protein JRH01_04005 [Deltaproteobacteria bacterium]|nr:hypothetical protein [Deltaproteobacteria bacterium]MBW2396149.1 hypothetical protein [Deltaproteobacteria bacterium]